MSDVVWCSGFMVQGVAGISRGGFTNRLRSAASERGVNHSNGLKDVRTEIGSSQGQNLALTGSCVPSSLDCG